jgi:hypothetical protein
MNAPLPDRRPWHEGEKAARLRTGAPDIAPVIRTALSDPQSAFFARLPLVFVAGLDAAGHPAASLLRGLPGFLSSPAPRQLEIAARFPTGERLMAHVGAPFGLIGVDFLARRRNRVNGGIASAHADGLTLAIDEAFGNCPKYIAPREIFPGASDWDVWTDLPERDAAARAMIAQADVFFVVTRGPDGVDLSHRGGPPGFVTLTPDGVLHIPDFPGNNYFNTFGNLLHDPRAALLFVDFPAGRALHLAGEARTHLSHDERSWTFAPRAVRLLTTTPIGSASA